MNPDDQTPPLPVETLKGKANALKRQERRLLKAPITENNKKIITGYEEQLLGFRRSHNTIGKRMNILMTEATIAGKDFNLLDIDDINRVLARLPLYESTSPRRRGRCMLDSSLADYRKELKRLYNNYLKTRDPLLDSDDPIVRSNRIRFYEHINSIEIKFKKPQRDCTLVITEEDAILLIQFCKTAQERAIVAALHGSGARADEFLHMRIRSVQRRKSHMIFRLYGKTDERNTHVLLPVPFVDAWLAMHPLRNDTNAPLWISQDPRRRDKPLSYAGLTLFLKDLFQRAGLKKPCNPHWFRHSRASIWAPMFSESVLCMQMGWVIGSAQVATYVHMNGERTESSFLSANNLEKSEERTPITKICTFCETTNNTIDKYCQKCHRPLSLDIAMEDDGLKSAAINNAMKVAAFIMKDPELRERYELFEKNFTE